MLTGWTLLLRQEKQTRHHWLGASTKKQQPVSPRTEGATKKYRIDILIQLINKADQEQKKIRANPARTGPTA